MPLPTPLPQAHLWAVPSRRTPAQPPAGNSRASALDLSIAAAAASAAAANGLPGLTLPDGFPPFLVEAHSIVESDVYANSKRGSGHHRKRRLYTVTERVVDVSLLLESSADAATFDAWFEGPLLAGHLPFSARVESEDGVLRWWKAKWTAPYTATPMVLGRFRIAGSLLLVGSGTTARPAPTSATLALGIALRGRASASGPLSASVSMGIALQKPAFLSAISLGIALLPSKRRPFSQTDWPVPRGRPPLLQGHVNPPLVLSVAPSSQWLARTTGWTLSNGNTTVTYTSGSGSTDTDSYRNTGKLYFEVLVGGTVNTGLPYAPSAGVSNSSFAAGGSGALPGGSVNGWVLGSDGGIYTNSGTLFTGLGTAAAGQVWMFALDCATKKLWIGRGGTWFNSGNPAAGTGQVATITGTSWTPISGMNNGPPSLTLRTANADFSTAAPSGFSSWSGS